MNRIKQLIVQIISIGFLGVSLSGVAAQENSEEAVAAALNHTDRPAEDRADDAQRMPAATLAFAGIMPGMDILELEAGGGYYTDILSRTVGPQGSVIFHNPPSFDAFLGDGPEIRLAGNRLPNVRVSKTNFDALDVEDNSIDMVTWIMGPHELWFAPAENVTLGDPTEAFAEIARVLKPGGVFLAIDHIAPDDSGTEAGGTLHRIREDIVSEHAQAAGLSMLRMSDLLKNPSDPLDIGVFDEPIQGRTSKFVVLYQK